MIARSLPDPYRRRPGHIMSGNLVDRSVWWDWSNWQRSPQAVAFPSWDSAQVLESHWVLVKAPEYYILSLSGELIEELSNNHNNMYTHP